MNNEKQKHLSILPQNLVAAAREKQDVHFPQHHLWFLPQDLECCSADDLYNLPSELRFYSAFSSNWLCQDDLNGEIQEAS